jgi:hypothetical protein
MFEGFAVRLHQARFMGDEERVEELEDAELGPMVLAVNCVGAAQSSDDCCATKRRSSSSRVSGLR